MLRRTPCVGICSTTYGDLVCRGCKRFSHEIVQWNGFADDQRRLVWQRLHELREGAVLSCLRIDDEVLLRAEAELLGVPMLGSLSVANIAYEVLRRSRNEIELSLLGLSPLAGDQAASELYRHIERELFERSVAHYERNFHVSAR
ncbi:MAG: DUF1289 domain-containing protein [Pseudomonadales bacterium]